METETSNTNSSSANSASRSTSHTSMTSLRTSDEGENEDEGETVWEYIDSLSSSSASSSIAQAISMDAVPRVYSSSEVLRLISTDDSIHMSCLNIQSRKKRKNLKKIGRIGEILSNVGQKSKSKLFQKLIRGGVSNDEISDYACALQGDNILIHGRLYLLEDWLYFYADKCGLERLVTIQWKDVIDITIHNGSGPISNAIQVDSVSEEFLFCSFVSRDNSYIALRRIWQNRLVGKPMSLDKLRAFCNSLHDKKSSKNEKDDDKDDVFHDCSTADFTSSNSSTQTDEVSLTGQRKQPYHQDSITPKDKSASEVDEVLCPCDKIHEGVENVNEEFDIDVDALYEHIFSQNSDLMKSVFESLTFKHVQYSPYQKDIDGKYFQILSYTIPLPQYNFGPQECDTQSRQCMDENNLPGSCYVVKVLNETVNVPYGESFYVNTQFCITRAAGNRSRLRVTTETVFTRNVFGIIRNIIIKRTSEAINEFLNCIVERLRLESVSGCTLPRKQPLKSRSNKSVLFSSKEEDNLDSVLSFSYHKLKNISSLGSCEITKPSGGTITADTKSEGLIDKMFFLTFIFLFCVLILTNIYMLSQISYLQQVLINHPVEERFMNNNEKLTDLMKCQKDFNNPKQCMLKDVIEDSIDSLQKLRAYIENIGGRSKSA